MQAWRYEFLTVKDARGLVFASRSYYERVVSTVGDGEQVLVTLTKPQDKRTNAQNRLAWGAVYDALLDGLADEVGYDRHDTDGKEKLHEALCIKYGGTVRDPMTGLDVRKFRTSKATKQQFTDFIEWVCRFAAQEHGVVITLPGER